MRRWLVGGALIEGPDGILLVRNTRRDGHVDWSPPGGVIDDGETLIEGLTREVAEETGLEVAAWAGPVYEIEADAPDLGWHLRVEVHRATEVGGALRVGDPDGIVTDLGYCPPDRLAERLGTGPRWVGEPLGEWLRARWSESRRFDYLVRGADLSTLRVERRA